MDKRLKVSDEDVVIIREMKAEGASYSEICRKFPQMSPSGINKIVLGITHKHLPVLPVVNGVVKSGTSHHKNVLNEADVLTIRALHSQGFGVTQIHRMYPQIGYTSSIMNIAKRKSWKHL